MVTSVVKLNLSLDPLPKGILGSTTGVLSVLTEASVGLFFLGISPGGPVRVGCFVGLR